jgi:hypothetical protein
MIKAAKRTEREKLFGKYEHRFRLIAPRSFQPHALRKPQKVEKKRFLFPTAAGRANESILIKG